MLKTKNHESPVLTKTGRILQHTLAWMNKTWLVPSHRAYNLTISTKKKFIWFRVAKVGTRSILKHLVNSRVELTAFELMQVYYLPGRFKNFFKFGFVRNPWDRLASGWQQMIVKNNHFGMPEEIRQPLMHLPAFIERMETNPVILTNHHFKPQHELLDLNNLDFLGRFETFERDFRTIMATVDVPVKRVPHYNRTGIKDYAGFYDQELREKVYRLYQKDFQIFYPHL